MSAPAAISGTFADFRTVKGRKVLQLIVEVPLEQANAALEALGGVPQPSDPKWVAIARLDPNAVRKAPEGEKERKRWDELPLSQQAALKLHDPVFGKFLVQQYPDCGNYHGDPDARLKQVLTIGSKRDLDSDAFAGARWIKLHEDYLAWQRGVR